MYEKYRCFRRQIANPWPVSQAGRLYAGADLFAQRRPGFDEQLQLRVQRRVYEPAFSEIIPS